MAASCVDLSKVPERLGSAGRLAWAGSSGDHAARRCAGCHARESVDGYRPGGAGLMTRTGPSA